MILVRMASKSRKRVETHSLKSANQTRWEKVTLRRKRWSTWTMSWRPRLLDKRLGRRDRVRDEINTRISSTIDPRTVGRGIIIIIIIIIIQTVRGPFRIGRALRSSNVEIGGAVTWSSIVCDNGMKSSSSSSRTIMMVGPLMRFRNISSNPIRSFDQSCVWSAGSWSALVQTSSRCRRLHCCCCFRRVCSIHVFNYFFPPNCNVPVNGFGDYFFSFKKIFNP